VKGALVPPPPGTTVRPPGPRRYARPPGQNRRGGVEPHRGGLCGPPSRFSFPCSLALLAGNACGKDTHEAPAPQSWARPTPQPERAGQAASAGRPAVAAQARFNTCGRECATAAGPGTGDGPGLRDHSTPRRAPTPPTREWQARVSDDQIRRSSKGAPSRWPEPCGMPLHTHLAITPTCSTGWSAHSAASPKHHEFGDLSRTASGPRSRSSRG